MAKNYFEGFEVGQTGVSNVNRTISESDVYLIAGLIGSYGQVHTNEQYARKTSYEGRIAQGGLLMLLMSGLGRRMPWDMSAAVVGYGYDRIRFPNAALIGDTVGLESEIIDKEVYDEEKGMLTFKEDLVRSDGDLLATRERKFLFQRTP